MKKDEETERSSREKEEEPCWNIFIVRSGRTAI